MGSSSVNSGSAGALALTSCGGFGGGCGLWLFFRTGSL